MPDLSYDLDLCGWRLHSAIALPELDPWHGPDRDPDIRIAIGEVPSLTAPIMQTPLAQVDMAGRVRFGVENVADYLVEDGRRIVIDPKVATESPEIRLFLLGSGVGFLCHQRGVLPLHAASVVIDGEAILLAGASGAGKSTLAAAMLRRGYPLLSDDVSPLDFEGGEPLIRPSVQRLRLWSDSAINAGWTERDTERCRAGLEKFTYSKPQQHPPRARAPRAMFHLRRQPGAKLGSSFQQLRGGVAAEEFLHQVYRWRSLVAIKGAARARFLCANAAAGIPQHFLLERPIRFDALDQTIDDVVSMVRATR